MESMRSIFLAVVFLIIGGSSGLAADFSSIINYYNAGGTSNSCPSGTYLFAWDGDHTDGSLVGCKNSGASTVTGTNTSGTISSSYGETGNGIQFTANNQHLIFPVSSEDLIDQDTGTVWMDLYINETTVPDSPVFWEAVNFADAYNYKLKLTFYTSEYVTGKYKAGTTEQTTGGSAAPVTLQTYIRIAYSWDSPNGRHCILVCGVDGTDCSTWDDTDIETLDTWVGNAIDRFTLGEDATGGGSSSEYWLDNVYSLSGYQTAHP